MVDPQVINWKQKLNTK